MTIWLATSVHVFDNIDSVVIKTSNPETHPKTETSR